MLGIPHIDGPVCWCAPKQYDPCPECLEIGEPPKGCLRCNGSGFVDHVPGSGVVVLELHCDYLDERT